MRDLNLIAPWVRRFLVEYLVIERNLSLNTQKSYRDTLSLLLPFIAKREKVAIDKLQIEHLSTESVREFFQNLRNERNCSTRTCNQRLACIHGLAQFIAWKSPENVSWAGQVRAIPFKNTTKTVIPYLEKSEINAIIDSPDTKTRQGIRDHAVLLFLYNTGARASEVVDLTVGDLDLKYSKSVKILGKGNKLRHCPLWKHTIATLEIIVLGRSPKEKLFLNRRGHSLTRFGIYILVEKYWGLAKLNCPSLAEKNVSPHVIRHTTAVHLLRSGVDINTIRAWLGHVSLDTTNIYAEVDLEMKSKALALCRVNGSDKDLKRRRSCWKEKPGLMNYLRSL
jgi:integrase/recombinase XerD